MQGPIFPFQSNPEKFIIVSNRKILSHIQALAWELEVRIYFETKTKNWLEVCPGCWEYIHPTWEKWNLGYGFIRVWATPSIANWFWMWTPDYFIMVSERVTYVCMPNGHTGSTSPKDVHVYGLKIRHTCGGVLRIYTSHMGKMGHCVYMGL